MLRVGHKINGCIRMEIMASIPFKVFEKCILDILITFIETVPNFV